MWIALTEALAGIDENFVRKTSTGCIRVEVDVLPLPVGRSLLKNWHLLQNLWTLEIYQHHISDLGIP
jgi:hypothetical protein